MALSSAAAASLTPLPDDIQRALQQAVGDANNAASAAAVQAKARKSKRQRDEIGEGSVAEDSNGNMKKKKKSKKHGADMNGDAEQAAASASASGVLGHLGVTARGRGLLAGGPGYPEAYVLQTARTYFRVL